MSQEEFNKSIKDLQRKGELSHVCIKTIIPKIKCFNCGSVENLELVSLGKTMQGYVCKKCLKEKYVKMRIYHPFEIWAKKDEIEDWKKYFKGEVIE
jgi:hypothetical protein